MATTADVMQRVDLNLQVVAAQVKDLPEIEQGWDQEPEANRLDLDREWWDLMGRLRSLHHAYHSGAMTPAQADTYRALVGDLRTALPIVRRLGLAEPPVPLEV